LNLSLLPYFQSSLLVNIVRGGISLPRVEMWSHHYLFWVDLDVDCALASFPCRLLCQIGDFCGGITRVFILSLASARLYYPHFLFTSSSGLCFFRHPLCTSLSFKVSSLAPQSRSIKNFGFFSSSSRFPKHSSKTFSISYLYRRSITLSLSFHDVVGYTMSTRHRIPMWCKGSPRNVSVDEFGSPSLNKQLNQLEKQFISLKDSQVQINDAKDKEMQLIFRTLTGQGEQLAKLRWENQILKHCLARQSPKVHQAPTLQKLQ